MLFWVVSPPPFQKLFLLLLSVLLLLTLINRQGKAILLFDSTEIASSITTKCIQKELLYNGTLQLHPSYCKLVEPNEKKTAIPEVRNIDLDGITCKITNNSYRCYTDKGER